MGLSKTIAIFETNPPSPVFNNTPATALWFEKIILKLRPKTNVVTYRVVSMEFPKTLHGIDGLIITGSSKEVYDNEIWISKTAEWLREARRENIPTLGVCFGSQLIAEFSGGKVTKNPKGREVGTCTISVLAKAQSDALLKGLPKKFTVQESHQSAVVVIPKDAELLASNTYGVQAFRLKNEQVWGVQFHPEMSAETLATIVRHRKPILQAEGIDTEKVLESLKPTKEAGKILKNFLDVIYRHANN